MTEARTPLTTDQLEQLSAGDMAHLRLTEDEKLRLREINGARAREREARAARLRAEEAPIIAELLASGKKVSSVWDLVNTATPYPEAIPVLVAHLPLPYSDRIREGIARALAVPEARSAWSTLVAEYRKTPFGEENGITLGAKSGLAAALSATATDSVVEELVALAKDRSQGSSRLLLLHGLKRSKAAVAREALEELAADPELSKEIASWRKRK